MQILFAVELLLCVGVVVSPSFGEAQAPSVTTVQSQVLSGGRKSAAQEDGQSISRGFANVSLYDALSTVAGDMGYSIVFNKKDVDLTRRVTTTLKKLSLDSAINQILSSTGYKAEAIGKSRTIAITRVDSRSARSAGRVLVGQVIDSMSGKGVSGATVSVAGTKRVATTRENGWYSLSGVPAGEQTVVARLIGYGTRSKTLKVEKDTVVVNFKLVQVSTTLTEVVTTVTGEQRKLEIGNSIASINVDSVMKTAPVRTLTDLLENRVPGLVVQRSSGQPGDPSRLRLRGAGSIYNNNDMIVVLDGVRIDGKATPFLASTSAAPGGATMGSNQYLASSAFDQIDPNSIETLDIFKGPSAAAMYGSDAANGVLVITTKRGKAGPARWSTMIDQGITYIPGKYPMGTYRFGSIYGVIPGRCSVFAEQPGLGLTCDVDSIVRFQALNDPYYTVLGTGLSTAQSVSVSGGSQSLQYSLTGSGSRQNGVLKMSEYLTDRYHEYYGSTLPSWMARPDRYSTWGGTGKFGTQVNPALRVELTSQLYNSDQRKTALGNSAISIWSRKFRGDTISPNEDRFYERAIRRQIRYTNTVNVNWQITPWLPITATAGIDAASVKDESYLPQGIPTGLGNKDTSGFYSIARGLSQTRSLVVNGRVPVWGNNLTTLFGLNLQNADREDIRASMLGLPPGIVVPDGGFTSTSHGATSITTLGWFVEPRINVRSRFFVMPGFRIDNNGFQGKRAGPLGLPKMNFSWIASEEDYFPLKDIVDLMRIRMAFGTAGTQPGPADRLRLFITDTGTSDNPAYRFNTALSALGNTQLRPERGVEFEGGFDAELWQGRLGIEFTGYRKVTHDAIVDVPLAPSIAFGHSLNQSYKANIGVIKNSGRELSLRMVIIESSKYGWQSQLGLSQNQNRVQRLNAGAVPLVIDGNLTPGATQRVVPGYPLWGVWARPILGVNDSDGNGRIQRDEVTLADSSVYLGQSDPKGTMNLFNNWTLFSGRITVNTGISYQYGLTQTSAVMGDASSPFNLAGNNPSATLMQQAVSAVSAETAFGITQTVNTWRFETLSINLNLGKKIASKFFAQNMSVSLQGKNLGIKSNYIGKDPNVNSALMGNGSTMDVGLISQPRVWSMRVSLGN